MTGRTSSRWSHGAIRVGLPVPVPLPRHRPPNDHPTWLPQRFVLEVARDEVRILDEDGERVLETWRRGHVAARVRVLDDVEVVLELRWSGVDRHGRIEAEPTADAVAVAELLAHDTRVADGADPEGDAALMRLAADTLPGELRRDRHAALRAVAALMTRGERPLVVAGGERGLSLGIVLLTDRTLYWWSGGRKAPVVLARDAIAEVATDRVGDLVELAVTDAGGRRTAIEVQPPERAAAIGELLVAELPESTPSGLAALVAADPDEALTRQLRRELELVGGATQRFDAVDPRDRAEAIAAALAA